VGAEEFKRKLTAILSADVQGYSRMMGEDEDSTIRTLTAYRDLMSTLIQKHRGRVVDSPGDNLLAEFGSVVDAVRCAVEIQEELRVRNDELPENRRMEFRIGINLGDVVEEGERIYGDGVNIAARVEGLAEGGGICISGTVYDSIKNKLSLSYEPMGEHTVKNIKEPIRVYRMRIGPEAAVPAIGDEKKGLKPWNRTALAAVAVLVLAAGAWAIWHLYFRPPPIEPASVKKMAYPLPDKPSIAVLPFDNLSGDAGQDYFSDGITEEIITALSKTPNLFVIARHSTFMYKGKPVKVQRISEELGVRYVLEGSIRKSADRVRITAQLIDALKGHHLWAESYDRDLKDIFKLQDEITKKIITALEVKLTVGEQARMWAKGTNNLDAYLKLLAARENLALSPKEGNVRARQLAKEAIDLDPQYAVAYATLGFTHMYDVWLGTTNSPKQSIVKAIGLVQKCISLDGSIGKAHGLLGLLYTMTERYEDGISEARKGVALEPNSDLALNYLGLTLRFGGKSEEAIPVIKKAIRVNPFAPGMYFFNLGLSYLNLGQYEEAVKACKEAAAREPNNLFAQLSLTAAYVLSGRKEAARRTAAEVLRIDPAFSIEGYSKTLKYKRQADKEHIINSLQGAGLPETPPLPLPDRPSIAVLPFVNMSGDPEQEYFSDGITEEIITALSKSQRLFVVARESTFSYKGKSIQIPRVGRELGVRYVLEGSVRMAENQVRITAQLIDAATGNHLWAERYDRELKHIFAIQDGITKKIVGALQVRLTDGEQARLYEKGTNNLQAFLKSLQGREYMYQFSREGIDRARPLLKEAIALDPNYAAPYRWLGGSYMLDVMLAQSKNPKESLMTAIRLAQKAISLDESFVPAYCLLAQLYAYMGKHDEGVALAERAISINPNSADAHNYLGHMLNLADRSAEAIPELKKGIRLNPIPPKNYLHHLAMAYMSTEQYEEALVTLRKVLDRDPNDFLAHLFLTRIYSESGRWKEARAEAAEVLRINPKFRVEKLRTMSARKNREKLERHIEALRKAGLK